MVFYTCGLTTLETRDKKTIVLGKSRSREYRKGNKTVPGKVSTTRTEDGHKHNTKRSITI
jgi:hypothetical protein